MIYMLELFLLENLSLKGDGKFLVSQFDDGFLMHFVLLVY